MNDVAALLTTAELAEQLTADGVPTTVDAVRAWLRDTTPPPVAAPGRQGQSHRWDYDQVLDWLAARAERPRAKGWTAPGAEHIEDPRIDKMRQEARLRRIQADELERRLIPADEVEQILEHVVDAARIALEGMPARLTQQLRSAPADDTTRRELIDAEIRRVLERLARRHGLDDTAQEPAA